MWNNEIQKPGALIRIKAPKQMGKPDLLKIIQEDNYVKVKCELYQIYFSDRLH
ncbi:AAA-like domain-containing protein [Sphaerospermopsis aphanizomenoides BCCUSP55]|uniref:AAA-like domain-containing protein n=1 Tax=Sphaerospermopsis aphanizomenoides TaxID=459663 RepID=UPI0019071E96|nr:AAA-like domain-containing protein [Sphaerospermopsis aphanizomenoides]MBK1986124.1 AAA-like domain-containing protein [Sphaerospermopsis aphanizomenoides BCCUSP55]